MAAAILDLKKRSIFTYHRVLLFNYDVQCKKPFSSYNRNMFSEEDIPKAWFTGPLTPANRKKVLSLSPLGGGRFSVFAKIEIGKTNIEVNNFHDRNADVLLLVQKFAIFKLRMLTVFNEWQ